MKLRTLLVLALCAIILVAGTACTAGSSYNGMTADQLIKNVEAASLNQSSSHIDATETVSGTIQEAGAGTSTINMVTHINGDIDLQNKKMYMNAAINGSAASTMMNMQMQTYMLDNWMYVGINMMGNTTWMKVKLTDTLWDKEQSSLLQYKDLLKDTVEVNVVGEETINGVACWKLNVQPDMEKLQGWYQTQMSGLLGNLSSGMDLSKMFKDVKITEWVAKDTYYTVKFDMTMSMDIEGVVADVSTTMSMSNFNQPVTITLPAAASKATDVSSSYSY